MECLNCNQVLTGRQRVHCSDRCRKALSRADKTHEDGPQSIKSDKLGQICPPNSDTISNPDKVGQAVNTMLSQSKGKLDPDTREIWQYHQVQRRPTVYPSTDRDWAGLCTTPVHGQG